MLILVSCICILYNCALPMKKKLIIIITITTIYALHNNIYNRAARAARLSAGGWWYTDHRGRRPQRESNGARGTGCTRDHGANRCTRTKTSRGRTQHGTGHIRPRPLLTVEVRGRALLWVPRVLAQWSIYAAMLFRTSTPAAHHAALRAWRGRARHVALRAWRERAPRAVRRWGIHREAQLTSRRAATTQRDEESETRCSSNGLSRPHRASTPARPGRGCRALGETPTTET